MSIWIKILLVALGGGLGAVCRYLMEFITRQPYGVWIINIFGCFLMGIFFGWWAIAPWSSDHKLAFRLLLMVGFVGGFSTFAHYILYITNYLRDGQFIFGFAYMLTTLLVGLLCTFAGIYIGMKI